MQPNKPPTNPNSPFETGRVLMLSTCHFIHDVYSSLLAPLLPLLIEKLSLSLTQAGFLTTIIQFPSLLNPYVGMMADRISVRYFIILAPAMTAVPMSLIGMAPNYGVLLLLLFISGISAAVFHVPAPVMVSRLSGTKVGKGMSYFMTGGELARTMGPMAAVGAVSLLGLEGFYPVMIFGLAASFWLYVKFKDVPISAQQSRKRARITEIWRQMRHVLGPLSAVLVARGFMHASMATFLPTYLKAETGNLWLAGFGLTIYEASGVVGVITSGSLSDYLGRRKILLISLVGAPLSLFLFTGTDGWIRYAALLFAGFTILSTSPVMLAIVQENATSSPAAANGFYMMVSFLARSAVVVLVGFVADFIGLQTTYYFSAAMGIVGIPFVFMLPKEEK